MRHADPMSRTRLENDEIDERACVWVVDDKEVVREEIRAILDAQTDIRCEAAFSSAEEVLTRLNSSFAPEVMLIDIEMPGMNGIELVKRLRRVATGTALVMLTIHDDNDAIVAAFREGASGYLCKPPEAEELGDAIRDVMKGGAVMSPGIARSVINMFAQQNAPRFDYGLTEAEKTVLQHLTGGLSKKAIGKQLKRSPHTVDTHLRSIYRKLHVNTQTAAVAKALNERLVG